MKQPDWGAKTAKEKVLLNYSIRSQVVVNRYPEKLKENSHKINVTWTKYQKICVADCAKQKDSRIVYRRSEWKDPFYV